MNARLLVCIGVGVLIAHLALLHVIDQWRALGKPLPKANEPNFTTSTVTYVDEAGRTVKKVHEFTVSTELADKATLKKLPPAPEAAVAEE